MVKVSLLFISVLTLFCFLIPGFILRKTKLADNGFAKALSVKCASGILVILPQGDKSALEYEESGIFVINRPISKQLMINSVKMSMIAKKRLEIMMDEQTKLKDKIEENRLIDRAKCVLIQYLRLSEPQAHRYIEKQAMDMRTSKMEVALGILKTYDS